MRIFITNNRLDYRGGAEAVVRDIAQAFQSRGHTVMAYTSNPEHCERLLQNDGIPVCTDPENLKYRPDIIHGQHHLDTMTALLSLPGIPAVYHCHGAVWSETQPRHPRIFRYLAMSETLRERMITESNLPEDKMEVVLNAVHTGRFSTVRTPPSRLTRALFYHGHHPMESPTLAAVREACDHHGLELECAGRRSVRRIEFPARELPNFDLVFASGKSAIDAMACGCAVIATGRDSAGPLITPENFDKLRRVNFSVAANCPPPLAEAVSQQIALYTAEAAAEVTQRVRTECSMDRMVDQLLGIYSQVLEESARQQPDLAAELVAAGNYLRKLVPLIKLLRDTQAKENVPLVTLDVLRRSRAQLEDLQRELHQLPRPGSTDNRRR